MAQTLTIGPFSSIGVTLFNRPPASLAALIEQADGALHESKQGGRDRIRLVDRTVAEGERVQVR